ncbi:hypothetical protein T440DRAFT_280289 [Plenodomus tracheiphilus IPT5]|uniref:Uncharacterized protein n=1 Tax=Plenodomus tracheiphilus IPT5 TaxID=1408161 RepID=A0A6A7AT62_9PLEO|nr:hypothetical protein T440DRAFT_280289 [Plenodomus tracheiphilus IPT5]
MYVVHDCGAESAETVVEPPKKRGRPAKAKGEEERAAQVDEAPTTRGRRSSLAPAPAPEPEPKKGRGRPRKGTSAAAAVAEETVPEADAPAPTKSTGRGRARKEIASLIEAPAAPRRGRPAKAAALNRRGATGSSRVSKRISPRTTKTKPAKVAVVTTPRLDPRVRSKLRTRIPTAKKATHQDPATLPSKRGRPKKTAAETSVPKTITAKEAAGRKPSKGVPEKILKPTVAKAAKSAVPRKRRGFTTLQVPDKFAPAVQEFYETLLAADAEDPFSLANEPAAHEGVGSSDAVTEKEDAHLTSATAGAEDDENSATSAGSDIVREREEMQPSSEAATEQDLENEDDEDEQEQEQEEDLSIPTNPSSLAAMQLNIEEVVQQEQNTDSADDGHFLVEEFDERVVVYQETRDVSSDDEEDLARPSPKPSAAIVFGAGL